MTGRGLCVGTVGSPVALQGDAAGGVPPYTYAWDLDGDGDYDDSFGQNPNYTWTVPGGYSVGLKVTDAMGATATASTTARINPAPGDVNGDGLLDVRDVRLCLQIALGVVTGTAEEQAAADLDGDGDVDRDDAEILAQYLIGVRDTLP